MPRVLFKLDVKAPPARKVGCVSFVECAVCGYEPGGLIPPRQCPKCLGHDTFHRVVVGGGALELAAPGRPSGCSTVGVGGLT
jgi:hypothetical protein